MIDINVHVKYREERRQGRKVIARKRKLSTDILTDRQTDRVNTICLRQLSLRWHNKHDYTAPVFHGCFIVGSNCQTRWRNGYM